MSEEKEAQNIRLIAACELVLLFYSSHWDAEKRTEWDTRMNQILGSPETRERQSVGANGDGTWDGAPPSNEATTKNLCNAVRAAISNEN